MSKSVLNDSIKKVRERLTLTLANIRHQKNIVYWDDLEKIEDCITALKSMESEDLQGQFEYIIKKIAKGEKSHAIDLINSWTKNQKNDAITYYNTRDVIGHIQGNINKSFSVAKKMVKEQM